jgi:hypothetical protein
MARTFFRGGREGQPEDRHSRVEAESRPRRVSEIKWPPHRRQKLPFRFIPKESRFSVAILADTNVVAAASGTLDDPDVTGMEIATACPNGGSYSSIEIVLGYRHDLALVVSADGAPHKESERPLYKRPVRAEAAHRRHTPPEQRFHRQLRQRVAFVAYHRSWKHRIKLLAPVSFGFGTFVLSLFLLTSFSAAARNFQSFDQPRRVQSSRPEQTFGRHKRAPRSVQVNIPLPPPRPRDLAGRKEPPRDAAPKDALAPALPPGDDPETCAAVLASENVVAEKIPPIHSGLCGIEHPLMLKAIILADKRHIQFEPPVGMRCRLAGAIAQWITEDVAPIVAASGQALAALSADSANGSEDRACGRTGLLLLPCGRTGLLLLRGTPRRLAGGEGLARPSAARAHHSGAQRHASVTPARGRRSDRDTTAAPERRARSCRLPARPTRLSLGRRDVP